jgi:hypothetical protein
VTRTPRGWWARIKAVAGSQRAAGCLWLLGAAFFALLALGAWDMDRALSLDSGAHLAAATVVDVHSCSGRGCDSYVRIRFQTASGRDVTLDMTEAYWNPEPRTGDVITVRYNEDDVEHYVRDERLGNDPFGIGMLVVFTMGFTVVGVLGLTGRYPEWIRDYGKH